MKKMRLFQIPFLAVLFFISTHANAISRVKAFFSKKGEIIFVIESTRYEVSISQTGKILNYTILSNGKISYDFDGRISKLGQVPISYDFQNRINYIDGERIGYDFDGRVKEIGSILIHYNFDKRIDKIGEYVISYNFDERIDAIGSSTISYDLRGNIETVNDNNEIIYFSFNEANKGNR